MYEREWQTISTGNTRGYLSHRESEALRRAGYQRYSDLLTDVADALERQKIYRRDTEALNLLHQRYTANKSTTNWNCANVDCPNRTDNYEATIKPHKVAGSTEAAPTYQLEETVVKHIWRA